MTSPEMTEWFARKASQMLFFYSVAGAFGGLIRWKHAARRDVLAAFIIFLVGTALAQVPAHLGVRWSVDLLILFSIGRCAQVFGAALFFVACVRDRWSPFAWGGVIASVLFVATILSP